MPELSVTVREKIAQVQGTPEVVCGNSDYTVTFALDSEWDAYAVKTARYVWYDTANGRFRYEDVLFEGSTARIPTIYNAYELLIGVYAGDIITSTPARIPCSGCITDGAPLHDDPPEDVYEQLLRYLQQTNNGIVPVRAAALTSFSKTAPKIAAPQVISEPEPMEEV